MNVKLALVAAGMAIASTCANAAVVNLTGDTISFSFDDSFLTQANSKYTGYTLEGNSLLFQPSAFFYADSQSLPASFGVIPTIKITANAGYVINELSLKEDGYYYDSGNANASAYAGFTVNNVLNPVSTADLGQIAEFGTWELHSSVNFDEPLQEAYVRVLNILTATSNSPFDFAYIDKNSVKITAQATLATAPVPVPGAIWLFGTAFAGFLVSRRNTQSA